MDWQTDSFDWNKARAFLVTAEEGSLSAAARALGKTQPTLGRQVTALEEELGVTLFERAGRSLVLTQSGLDLLEHFKAMAYAANLVSLAASGQSQAIEGHVSISATSLVATHHLPPVLKELRQIAPGIEIEIVATNDISDLTRREADIAIRHTRPEQPDLIAKLLGETTGHLYASTEFLDRFGRPTKAEDLAEADFVGFDDKDRYVAFLVAKGLPVTARNFMLGSASGTVMLELVKEGLGIGAFTQDIAAVTPCLEPVLQDIFAVPVPIWVVTHRELHTSRRIRVVFDLLAEAISTTTN